MSHLNLESESILKRDANDVSAEEGLEELRCQTENLAASALKSAIDEYPTVMDLLQKYDRRLDQSVIHGLLREGEIMTINAPPKSGKTWLEYHIALCVAAGGWFMNVEAWKCEQGPVVIFDNELRDKTSAYRIPKVCDAMGMDMGWCENIRVKNFRGNIPDIDELKDHFLKVRTLRPKLIILDALYRFLPEDGDENSNSYMTKVYNKLDRYIASVPGAALLIVHHTSKGNQADKSVVDVGSGASAGSRASDTVIAIREHEADKTYRFDALVRSDKSPDPIACKWDFPLWSLSDADPALLKGRKIRPQEKQKSLPREQEAETAMLPALSGDWQQKREVIQKLKIQFSSMTAAAVVQLVDQVVTKRQLFDLRPRDGERDCGVFVAQHDGKALRFKLKG